jgi:hypothetical protein
MASIAAIVVSVPHRHRLLAEAVEGVYRQRRPPDTCLVGIDYEPRLGEVANANRLIDAAAGADWFAFCHDDDVWLDDHLEVAEGFFETADVIVSDFVVEGRPWDIRKWDDFEMLRRTNWFPPSAVVARASTFGRWTPPPTPPPDDWVDWSNWRRLLDAGARFVHTNTTTMRYRFHGDNGSWWG